MWRDKADPNAVDPATALVESDTRSQLAKKIRSGIRRLPPQQARAVQLTYIDGLTYAQTAERMQKTVNTIKTHIRKGKERLANILTADEVFKELRDIDREWLIPGWLPANTATLFTGDGGAEKSWITLQAVCQVACGFNNAFLNPEFPMPSEADNSIESKHIVFATYEEEPAEIKHRLHVLASGINWIAESLETIKQHLHIVDMRGVGRIWGPSDNKHIAITGKLLPAGEQLRAICVERQAKLLVMDPLSGAFGDNENDPTAVYDFVSSFRGWGDAVECAMLVIGHLPKGAEGCAAGFSGSTAWETSTRSMWMLSKQDAGDSKNPEEYWALLHTKSNYAPLEKEKPLVKSPYGWWLKARDRTRLLMPAKTIRGKTHHIEGKRFV